MLIENVKTQREIPTKHTRMIGPIHKLNCLLQMKHGLNMGYGIMYGMAYLLCGAISGCVFRGKLANTHGVCAMPIKIKSLAPKSMQHIM